MRQLKIVAVVAFFVVPSGCGKKETTTTAPLPAVQSVPPKVEPPASSPLQEVLKAKQDGLQRTWDTVQADTEKLKKAKSDSEREIAFTALYSGYSLLLKRCDEAEMAYDRVEQAHGLQPGGQTFKESLSSIRAAAKQALAGIDTNRKMKRDFEKARQSQD